MKRVQPLLSVIVPIYNVGTYLNQCIDSIRCQTYTNLEIILVDDGSTDSSSTICDMYAIKDNRIRVVHKENGGLVSARKAGVHLSVGEYVTFVDGDDWLDSDAYESVFSLMNGINAPDMIVYGCVEEYGSFCKPVTNKVKAELYTGTELEELKNHILMDDYFFEWNILPHLCDKIIKRKLLEKNLNNVHDSITFGEDAACSYPCMIQADSILVSKLVPYHYRQREGSIVRCGKEITLENFSYIYQVLSKNFFARKILMEQLQLYMFFLLLLKSYSLFENTMPIFPFEEIKANSRIYLYGAGGFGKILKKHLERSATLEFVGWTDGNAENLKRSGLKISTIEEMIVSEFDYIVVSILNERIAEQIRKELEKMGISHKKIVIIQKEKLNSKYLPGWCNYISKNN